MKKFKKLAVLLLTGTLALSLLTGCSTAASVAASKYGSVMIENTMREVNIARNDVSGKRMPTLTNNDALSNALGKMLEQVDADTGLINGADAGVYTTTRNSDGTYRVECKMVLTEELTAQMLKCIYPDYGETGSDGAERYQKLLETYQASSCEAANIDTYNEYYSTRMFVEAYSAFAPYMTKFAVNYRFVDDTYLYVALGFAAENVPEALVTE